MPGKSEIEFSDSYHVAKTSLLTYTCSGGAVFGLDFVSSTGYQKISINYSGRNQIMTTTAIENLSGIEIFYYYKTKDNKKQLPDFALTLSYDSIHWSVPMPAGTSSVAGANNYSFVPGKYFVRLTNLNSNSASVFKIVYYFGESCNCFLYIP